MNLVQLLNLLGKFGPKITLIWPSLVIILAEVKKIMETLRADENAPPVYALPAKFGTKETLQVFTELGLDESEVQSMIDAFAEFDSMQVQATQLFGAVPGDAEEKRSGLGDLSKATRLLARTKRDKLREGFNEDEANDLAYEAVKAEFGASPIWVTILITILQAWLNR